MKIAFPRTLNSIGAPMNWVLRLLSAYAAATALQAPARAEAMEDCVYLAPAAAARNSGRRPTEPVTVDTGLALAAKDRGVRCLLMMPGRYDLTGPLILKSRNRPLVLSAYRRATVVIDGGGKVGTAISVNGDRLTVRGLTIQNFAQNGIVMNGSDITIADNIITDIGSSGWSQAAIHGVHFIRGARVINNQVLRTDYAGILFESSKDGELSDIRIESNRVADVCRKVDDCGAIYGMGRSARSSGFVVTGNTIRDYGPKAAMPRAIYLDDFLSDAVVSRNRISGSGGYAVQIHGGSRNRITGNSFDIRGASGLLFYQDKGGRPMTGNVVEDNEVILARAQRGREGKFDLRSNDRIGVERNRFREMQASSVSRAGLVCRRLSCSSC